MPPLKPPAEAETVQTVDGRIFWSRDNWATVYLIQRGKQRKLGGKEADLARFLAVAQSSAGA